MVWKNLARIAAAGAIAVSRALARAVQEEMNGIIYDDNLITESLKPQNKLPNEPQRQTKLRELQAVQPNAHDGNSKKWPDWMHDWAFLCKSQCKFWT